MGLMNKLRDSMPWVLAGMAGIFFLTIIFDWGAQGTVFQGSAPDKNTIGIVDGVKISNQEYLNTFEQMRAQKLQQSGKKDLTEQELEQVSQEAWDRVVNTALMKKQAAEMGLSVTDQEVRDLLLYNPPQYLRQQFTDSTGQFNQQAYWSELQNPKNDTLVREIEKGMRQSLLIDKWQMAMAGSLIIPNAEVNRRFHNEQDKASINFIKIIPKELPTDFISKVTDAQVQKYYDEHKNRFKQDEQRIVKFGFFSLAPTGRDSALAQEGLESLRRRFAAAPLDGIDSFARDLADELGVEAGKAQPIPPSMWGNNPQFIDVKAGDAVVNEAVGPQGQSMGTSITKIVSVSDTQGTAFKSRHILIGFGPKPEAVNAPKPTENRDSAKIVADRIYNELKAGAKFEELAMKYSQDQSARNGGDVGWVVKGQFVKEYEQVALNAPLNVIQPPVASKYGYHIIEVQGRTSKSIVGISIPYQLKTSTRTTQLAMQQANVFKARAEEDGFDQAAKELGVQLTDKVPPLEKKSARNIVGNSKLVAEIFEADKGDILNPVRLTQQGVIIVTQIVDIQPKGFRKLDDVKETIKSEIARKMRVESVKARAEQIRGAIGNSGNLAAALSMDSSLRVDTATISPAESVPTVGVDYIVNNTAFAQKEGEISPALKGENGYFIVQTVSRKINDENAFKEALGNLRNTIRGEKQQRLIGGYLEKLKEKAAIQDFRGN